MLDVKNLLTDEQMLQFITKGYVVLRNEVPQELHQDVMKKIHYVLQHEGNPGNNILPRVPEIQKLFETPVVKGALTSVLGTDYYMHPHRHCHYNQPGNQTPGGGQWHKDGFWSSMRSHRPWWAMIFYYTQDITEEMGPTAIMPGTQYYEKFLGDKGETILPTGKAGTMVLVHFDLWHKASFNSSTIDRYMLKFQFVRLSVPKYPTWNHTDPTFVIPDGVPALHEDLWRDVWEWLRGESPRSAVNLPVEDSRVQELGQSLQDSAETVALNAAYALGTMGYKGADELLKQLREGTNLVAARAAYGLQSAGSGAVPGLIKTLGHQEEKRRALAAFVLGMLGSAASEAVPSLIAIIEDNSEWVRRNVIEALGMIVHPADMVVPALAGALETSLENESDSEDPTDLYVSNQKYIINKAGYTASLSLLRAGREGDPAIVLRALEKALSSKDRYVRAYAFEALGHLRTEEATEVLIQYFRSARWCPDTHKASTF